MSDLTPEARRELKSLASTAAAKQIDRWMLIVLAAGLVAWAIRTWVLDEPTTKTIVIECVDKAPQPEGTLDL